MSPIYYELVEREINFNELPEINKPILLEDRAVISLSGDGVFDFFQSITTNDLKKLKINSDIIYSLMLSPQGKFLYDFFVFSPKFEDGKLQSILVDCLKINQDEIINKLNLLKLRAKVTITKTNLKVYFTSNSDISANLLKDPRHENLGFRFYQENEIDDLAQKEKYNLRRILLKIPESNYELKKQEVFPHDYNLDQLNAIDYEKGCYTGQEVTARVHYLSKAKDRKKLSLFKKSNKETNFEYKINKLINSNGKEFVVETIESNYLLTLI